MVRSLAIALVLLGLSACSGPDKETDKGTSGFTSSGTSTQGSASGGSDSGETVSGDSSSGETDAGDTSSGETASGDTSSGDTSSGGTDSGGNATGEFVLDAVAPVELTEGSANGVDIPFTISRTNGHNKNINVTVEGVNDADERLVTINTDAAQLGGTQSAGTIKLQLAIDDLPILSQQRSFNVIASDDTSSSSITVDVNVKPVDAPNVYLLIGQSNMVGFSGDGTKLAGPGQPDEPNPRILQLNATKNDQFEVFTSEVAFTSIASNVIESRRIVQAEDPLHVPLDPNNTSGKDVSYIGMGLSFAKEALKSTENTIVLVPAAWSGSSFCLNADAPIGQWNAQDTSNPNLGNTWLFDRAVTRTNLTLAETGGVLRGILWHQGESDSNDRCAGEYLANLERLAKELRLQIEPDQRGAGMRQPDANIPFVLGTMSRGVDENGDLSNFWPAKQLIDDAHRELPSKVSHAAITISDDLTPANGFPCGNENCIHYGPGALREMGRRYYEAIQRAAANP